MEVREADDSERHIGIIRQTKQNKTKHQKTEEVRHFRRIGMT